MSGARYDAVVVGAGPNGLSAGITLARRGRSVLVVEAADRPGGAVKSEQLTLPGFVHDVFSAVYPAAVASPVFAAMPLERHGLRWVHPEVAMAHPLDDGRAAALYRDLDRTVDALDAITPGDGAGWRRIVEPYLRHWQALRRTMLGAFPPLPGVVRILAGLGLQGALDFARLLLMPAAGLAAERFRGPHATAWLYGSALHGDTPPEEAGSAIAALYLNLMGHAVGWPSPQGGAERLTEALVGHLRELGGELRCGAPVERILVAEGRVAGVGIAGGDAVASDVVVCDLTPRQLLAVAGEALPEGYRERLVGWRSGPHTLKVDWALSGPVPWTAEVVRKAGTVHVGGDARDLLRATTALRLGELAERPFLLFGQQSIADPTRAPEGKHTAWGYTRVPAGVDWQREAERHVERIEAQVERFAPGFRDRILARHVLTPPALESRDANLTGGDVGGGSYQLDQTVFRPVPSLSPYRTPLPGLYIGSAAAFPGGAVQGVPGAAAARLAATESTPRRLVRRVRRRR